MTEPQSFRPYQQTAYERTVAAYRELARAGRPLPPSVLLVSPTGSGKTVMMSGFAVRAVARRRRVLWMAHRVELLEQAQRTLLRAGLPRVGIRCSTHPRIVAPVQVASIDGLKDVDLGELAGKGDLAIFDEAHHAAAKTRKSIVLELRARGVTVLGGTATPERGDGQGLGGDLFDTMIEVTTIPELQRLGWLVPCLTLRPPVAMGDLSMDPVAAYLARSPGKRTIVFAESVKHGEQLALAFAAAAVPAAMVQGKTAALLRASRVEAFRKQGDEGKLALLGASSFDRPPIVLIGCELFVEGFDCPEVEHVITACGIGSRPRLLQIVGRGMRTAPGKSRMIWSDLRGVSNDLMVPEAPQRWSLDGVACSVVRKTYDREPQTCPACSAAVAVWRTDADGWRCCPECRERVAKPEPVVVRPTVQLAAGRLATPKQKRAGLEKLARDAARLGRKPGSVFYGYLGAYGEKLPRAVVAAAYAQAIRDQGHPPPMREQAPPADPLAWNACQWCALPWAACRCQAG